MSRRNNEDESTTVEADVATEASTQEEAQQETQEAPKEESLTVPAEDRVATLVRPGFGMEEVPTPETQPDPEDYNDAVFAKKREAWEAANPESVQENRERDAENA